MSGSLSSTRAVHNSSRIPREEQNCREVQLESLSRDSLVSNLLHKLDNVVLRGTTKEKLVERGDEVDTEAAQPFVSSSDIIEELKHFQVESQMELGLGYRGI